MFERYTERARRVVFFARYEASQFGSTTIETEHMLLGLTREDRNFLKRLVGDAYSIDTIRSEIEKRFPLREKVSTSIDLPLSNECKRVLAYAHEETERLKHAHIGTEHILLGLLREPGTVAGQVLAECGVELEKVRDALALGPPPPEAPPPADREGVLELVKNLPEAVLGWAKMMLESIRIGPPRPPYVPRELNMRAGGRNSSSRSEGEAVIVESDLYHRGHKITIIERLELSADGKKLSYSHEVIGPKKQQKHAMDFDVS